jgi:hypothetical protein
VAAQSGSVLEDLLARLAVAVGGFVEVSGDELASWLQDDVDALKSHAVLLPGKPVESAICPGCERACGMPVQVLLRAGRPASLFIVCDKPVDINRVAVVPAALERWRLTATGLADALARLLSNGGASPSDVVAQGFRLGVVKGRKDKAELHLRVGPGRPRLVVAGHEIELALLLAVHQQQLVLDMRWLAQCVDAPVANAAVVIEDPEERRKRLTARVAREKAKGTRGFLKVVAAEEDITVPRLKQLVAAPKQPAADWTAPLSMTSATSSKKPKR